MSRTELPPVGNIYMLGGDGPDGEEPPEGMVFVVMTAKVEDARRMALYEDHVLLTKFEYEPLRFLRAAASQAEKQCPHHKEGLGMCLHCNPPPTECDTV